MIEVYAYATPNSIKVPIALEELGLDYALHPVNVKQGEQKQESFLALNPNAKVPVLVQTDTATGDRLVLSESAAILVYLAERQGRLLPAAGNARARVFEQLFFHASAVSPSFGNAGFFTKLAAEPQPLAQQRFSSEAKRVTKVLDGLLAERTYVAGDDYSIADIATSAGFGAAPSPASNWMPIRISPVGTPSSNSGPLFSGPSRASTRSPPPEPRVRWQRPSDAVQGNPSCPSCSHRSVPGPWRSAIASSWRHSHACAPIPATARMR